MKTLYRATRVRTLSHTVDGEWLLVDGRHVERVGSGDPPAADRTVELARALCSDEDGGIEEGSHLFGEEICNLGGKFREIVVKRLRRGCVPDSL